MWDVNYVSLYDTICWKKTCLNYKQKCSFNITSRVYCLSDTTAIDQYNSNMATLFNGRLWCEYCIFLSISAAKCVKYQAVFISQAWSCTKMEGS